MRRSLVVVLIVSTVSGFVPSAAAVQFKPKMSEPESFKDVLFGLQETRDNIEQVDCGGWNEPSSGQANGTSISGDVPLPDISPDVPGRKNEDATAHPTFGVGERGTFEFPSTAFGYLSACQLHEKHMHDKDLEKLQLDIKYDDVGVDEDPNVRVEGGNGDIDINPYDWCIIPGKATPRWCEKLFKTWLQEAAIAPRPAPNPLCPEPPKKYCFDPEFTKTCTGEECRTLNQPSFENKLAECHEELDATNTPFVVTDVEGKQSAEMSSFYRHYGNSFNDWSETKNKDQSPLKVTTPGKEWKLRVECYDYYKEKDPKETVMGPGDEQCEIVNLTEDEQSPDKPEWKDGAEKQKDKVKADDSVVKEDPRDPRDIDDPWVPDTETNLSIVDIEKLKDAQKNQADPTDITSVMGTILQTKQRGGKTVPDHARTDNFNDDDHRAFAKFWEKQQTELQKMVQDPTTKLVMPSRFLVGLADDDPLYRYVRGIVSRSDGTVEMTLRAGPEDIGNVLESFMRVSIGPIQQVRIPIAVPLVSDAEIDLLIFQWKQWQQYEERDANAHLRASFASDADPLIAKLENYKTEAQKARRLRNALVEYLGKLYTPQKKIREYVADWYKQNSVLLQQAAARAVQKRELKELWRDTQKVMLEADETQLNWCSNQRYSLAVYSLLDLWWGDVGPGGDREPDYVPPGDLTALGYVVPKDQQYDFSDMKFSKEPLLIPVLWPVQVSVRLPQPPSVGTKPPPPSDFPDLPPVPDEKIFDSFTVPDVDLPPQTLITVPVSPDLTDAITTLGDFKAIVEKMKTTYERFQPSILIAPDKEQKTGNPAKIIHVENDLKERIARLFSRWMPERKVDYAGRAARLNEEFPSPKKPKCKEDVVCLFLPPETQTKISWQWFVPQTTEDFSSFADDVKSRTVPADESSNPYDAPTLPVLERMFPKLTLPVIIDLEPFPTFGP